VNHKLDWVTKRSLCSLPNVFKELRLQVEEDVKTRNALRPDNSPYGFSVAASGDDFTVLLMANDIHRSVIFSLAEHALFVRDDKDTTMFKVTLSFNDQGDCRLHVNEEEREFWQVRGMALEGLLFQGYYAQVEATVAPSKKRVHAADRLPSFIRLSKVLR
jgi:hypothetical protein